MGIGVVVVRVWVWECCRWHCRFVIDKEIVQGSKVARTNVDCVLLLLFVVREHLCCYESLLKLVCSPN